MHILARVLTDLTWAFLAVLTFRLIMSYVFLFAPSYRASGTMAVLLELDYTITDPPLRLLRRLIPPLRIGSVAIDLGFMLLWVFCWALINYVWPSLG